ncbi:UNVERIFIED_CONTAM: hypothetical protein PYX00_007712 [Menopon gallinae]|uniref:Cytochrome P450 n=1 Tax=Menopon gallinae TaxID=328185 RepID=A0AAW2HJW8_9NEOP
MSVIFLVVVLFAAAFLLFYLRFRLVGSKYWERRCVPHLKPMFLLGNVWRAYITVNLNDILAELYLANREKRVLGMWFFNNPSLMVMDREIMKRILIKDFNIFRDRGFEINEDIDPLAGHLFLISGKKWRNLRVKLTPTFSSGKMKMMFPTIAHCAKQLQEHLKEPAEAGKVIEVKEMLARFTTDVISSCAFGIETNSLKNPKSEFRKHGKRIFEADLRNMVVNMMLFVYPNLTKMFKLRVIPEDVTEFFINAVRETVEHREKTNTKRNDFLQLVMQLMKAGKIEDADKTPVDGMTDEEMVQKFTLHEAAAQCFVFFIAGFETSSTTLTYCLYELARNPDIQKRLQDEIDSVMIDCSGQVTYEGLHSMEYLDMVVQETLRKYPPVTILQRKCTQDYHIPELNTTVEKGITVMFPVWGIHRDPDLYPNPDRFDPERFTAEERARRDTCAYLPFGEGPRNCIGTRFGLMQVKIALFYMLSAYEVDVASTTPIPIKYEVKTFILTPAGGMNLVFRKRA